MTVGVEQINWAYTGNGATDVWGFTFSSKSDSDVEVYLKEGVLAEVKLNPADYTLSRTDSGGNVTYPKTGSKLTSSDRIAVKRNSVKGNDYDFKSQARVNTIEIENSDDDKARQIQELSEELSRSVKVEPTSEIDPAVLIAQLSVDAASAEASKDAAAISETLSEEWATKTDTIVDTTDYSSKEFAIGSQAGTGGSSKNWAQTAEDTLVDGTEYSAKHYSAKSSTSSVASAASAAAAASSAAEGLYNTVVTKTFADSPIVPLVAEEGYLYKIDTSGGNVVINLSTLSVYGEDMKFAFVKSTADANTITINRGGTDTIDGGTSAVVSLQYETNVITGNLEDGEWIKSVQSAALADNSVTLAKMAGITAGNIIAGDASNNPAYVATGTAGQVLTSGGAGVAPTMQDADGGAWELLTTASANSDTVIDFTSGITSAYDMFALHCVGVKTSAEATMFLRTSSDGGATFDSTSGDYTYNLNGYRSGTTAEQFNYSTAAAACQLTIANTGINANDSFNSVINLYRPHDTGFYKQLSALTSSNDNNTANGLSIVNNNFLRKSTAAVNALRVFPNAGNIVSGEFYLYGIKNT